VNPKLVSSLDAVARSRLATISDHGLVADAARVLSNTHIGLVVVCDSDGAMTGVVTKTDIVEHIGHCRGNACSIAAAGVISRDVVYCRPTDRLPDVLSMMHDFGFVHIPVVDLSCRPSGVVSARDALRALMAEEEYEGSLLRDYVMGVGYR
jgi:CBS domain-containing protein